MKSWQYAVSVAVGILCLGLSVATVLTARSNLALQRDIQARQRQLENSLLGPQAQQIANSILQDMATTAATSATMRELLAKHGYRIPASRAADTDNKARAEGK